MERYFVHCEKKIGDKLTIFNSDVDESFDSVQSVFDDILFSYVREHYSDLDDMCISSDIMDYMGCDYVSHEDKLKGISICMSINSCEDCLLDN